MTKFRDFTPKARIIIMIALVLVLCGFIAAGAYWFIASSMLSRTYEPELVIAAPDGQHELVIREYSCLGGAGAELYIRRPGQDKWYNSWREKQIGNAGTDDYYQPFSAGKYDVQWESNQVTVRYYQNVAIENGADPSTWKGVVRYEFE